MCSKCAVFFGFFWVHLISIGDINCTQRYEFFDKWSPVSRDVNGINGDMIVPNFPFSSSHNSRPTRQLSFPDSKSSIDGRTPNKSGPSQLEVNPQWSYDLPHSLIAETDVEYAQHVNHENDKKRQNGPREPKLTVGFTKDFVMRSEEVPVNINDYRFLIANASKTQSQKTSKDQSFRGLSPEALAKITETLGAINTVGRYLVNYTRGSASPTEFFLNNQQTDPAAIEHKPNEDLPKAIYTISKNVLGRNMTDTIAPIVKGALPPLVTLTSSKVVIPESNEGVTRPCTMPNGAYGNCEDLSNCPQLLLNLSHLRQSICFKSLFVPGVCCPRKAAIETLTNVKPNHDQPAIHYSTTTGKPPHIAGTNDKLQLISVMTTSHPATIINEDCGQTQVEKFRVVGGEESLPGRWPWMAAIFLHGTRRTEFWCGGALIGPKHILTAAHCTRDSKQRLFNAHQFTVRLGDVDLRREDEPSSPETYHVTDVRAHPRFSRVGFYNDIAVLILDRKVRKNRYIIPLCLPPETLRNEKFIGQRPTVVGWGTTYYGGKESTVQRQVELPVWKNEDCDKTYFQPINENFICAGLKEGGKDACQGDSGGPLMLRKDGRWTQIGIVSFGNKCGEPGYPGVYTRVTQYLDWIQENLI